MRLKTKESDWSKEKNLRLTLFIVSLFDRSNSISISVTRLGNLLDFGQLFKAFDNNEFAQISHILMQFL